MEIKSWRSKDDGFIRHMNSLKSFTLLLLVRLSITSFNARTSGLDW